MKSGKKGRFLKASTTWPALNAIPEIRLKTKLKIAVRTLIEHVLRAGDLKLEFLSSSRPVEAIRAHQKIQKSRPENYIFEVPVTYQWETDRFLLEINGRIDGVYCLGDGKNQDRVIVDEI